MATLNDVIVVNIGYRLGALGFIGLAIPDAPGNLGMFDQLMALQWIQTNIKNFGGDPDRVTIFGQSAGSASVSLHLVSSLSTGLYSKAILESGPPGVKMLTLTQDELTTNVLELAGALGCDVTTDVTEIMQCLRSAPAEDIVLKHMEAMLIFTTSIDDNFLVEMSEVTIANGKFNRVPIAVGISQNEGSLFLAAFLPGMYL